MADTFVQLVGNLTDDPEVRFTPVGTQVGSFRLAVTPRVREGDQWKNGETSYFTITCWRDLANHTAESLSKGDRALVLGRLKLPVARELHAKVLLTTDDEWIASTDRGVEIFESDDPVVVNRKFLARNRVRLLVLAPRHDAHHHAARRVRVGPNAGLGQD